MKRMCLPILMLVFLALNTRAAARWDEMDYGPFLSSSMTMFKADPEKPEGITLKGITVKFDGGKAGVCFDTDLLSYRGAWTGGWLKLMGTPFDGTHRPPEGSRPAPVGKAFLSSKAGPGCASPDDNWEDPRPRPYGPLPRAWGHYKGLYVHGDRVVFSYSVGDRDVLEMPWIDVLDGFPCSHVVRLGPSKHSTHLLVHNQSPIVSVSVQTDSDMVNQMIRDGMTVEFPPSDKVTLTRIIVIDEKVPRDDQTRVRGILRDRVPLIDPVEFTKGGPIRWSGDVWIVSGIDEKLEHLKWKRFAAGLFQPVGLKIIDGAIHVLGRDQITKLHDLNKDGEADFYENFNNDVEVTPNFHEFAFELNSDPAGNLYFTKGAPLLGTLYFDPIGKHNGCVMRASKNGSKLDIYATGLRAPNGGSVGPEGQVTCSDNQGIWTPVCRINLVKEGGFYGCMGTHHKEKAPTTYDPPICWIPFGVDNSSGAQAWVNSDKWGLPQGSLVHLSYGKCKLFKVLWEQNAAGVPQGGVVRFPLNFATGTMRGRFSPGDKQLYIAGLKGWQTDGQQDGALQRVRYTGKPVYSVTAAKVTHDGIDLTFTQPLRPEFAKDLENYAVERWNYLWSKDYGSPEFKKSRPNEQGHDSVEVTSAILSEDRKTVSLKLTDMKPVMQLMVKVNVESAEGKPIEIEYFGTVNWVP